MINLNERLQYVNEATDFHIMVCDIIFIAMWQR